MPASQGRKGFENTGGSRHYPPTAASTTETKGAKALVKILDSISSPAIFVYVFFNHASGPTIVRLMEVIEVFLIELAERDKRGECASYDEQRMAIIARAAKRGFPNG